MEQSLLDSLKRMNFTEKVNYFEFDENIESVLVSGKHNEKAPMVTVVLPTFKRADLIKRAVDSVLEQEGFDDYQLLIVDNDPNFDEVTETQRIVQDYNSDKIIYYRNKENLGLYANWNRGVKLAKSEWVCIINDDDVLKKNHLKLMTAMVKEHKQIDYLACAHDPMDFRKDPNLDVEKIKTAVDCKEMTADRIDLFDFNFEFKALLLGSLIRRSVFMDVGGLRPQTGLASEDYALVVKIARFYNVFATKEELYGYCWGGNESMKFSIWTDATIHKYYVYKSISQRRAKLLRGIYTRRSKYMIIDEANRMCEGKSFLLAPCELDIEYIRQSCEFKKFKYNFLFKKINSALSYLTEGFSRKKPETVKTRF